jgi:uncharacterized protein YjbJ (UPF0337 family)
MTGTTPDGRRVRHRTEIPRRPAQTFSSRQRAGRLPGSQFEEHVMGINKDQVKGRVKEAEGTIKEAAGKTVGNERLQAKGKIEKVLGKAQAAFGDVKQDVKDAK